MTIYKKIIVKNIYPVLPLLIGVFEKGWKHQKLGITEKGQVATWKVLPLILPLLKGKLCLKYAKLCRFMIELWGSKNWRKAWNIKVLKGFGING